MTDKYVMTFPNVNKISVCLSGTHYYEKYTKTLLGKKLFVTMIQYLKENIF